MNQIKVNLCKQFRTKERPIAVQLIEKDIENPISEKMQKIFFESSPRFAI
jgi:hypothetical protein